MYGPSDLDDDAEAHLGRIERRFRRIAAEMSEADLQHEHGEDIAAEDIFAPEESASRLFVGYYSQAGLKDALQRYGILQQVAGAAACSPEDLDVSIDTRDPFHHLLRVHRRALRGGAAEPGDMLVELRLHLREHPAEGGPDFARMVPNDGHAGYVACEWLVMQRPGAPFSPTRPRLPGQAHPGLGVGAEVQTLLTILAERLHRHGLLAYPAWYHAAAMYAARFRFLDPRAEGRFRALRRDGARAGLSLDALSWAIELGCVSTSEGETLEWVAHEELLPLSPEARAYLEAPAYRRACAEEEAAARFDFDLAALAQRRSAAEAQAEESGRRAQQAASAAARARGPQR
jgi:hypothetical protein